MMMQLQLRDSLPFITIRVGYNGKTVEITDVLLDTGSASTIIAADGLAAIDIKPAADDVLHTIRGVGGVEVVFLRKIDYLDVGDCRIGNFEIEVGGMDYGFGINGILGMDFLTQAGAIINLRELRLDFVQ